MDFSARKKPLRVAPTAKQGCKHIPDYSRPKLYPKIFIFI